MSKNTPRQLAVALYEVTKKLDGKDQQKAIQNFSKLVASSHQLKQVDKIIEEFIRYGKKQEGITQIEVTSAQELDEKMLEKIKKYFGNQVEASVQIDPDLLGGIKIKTDDKILDGSLKTQLKKLKESII